MKIPFTEAYVFWTPWWDVDHHVYGCPIEVYVHTSGWFLSVRPFSSFAQGGDRRGDDPWRGERTAKWYVMDENPEIWDQIRDGGHKCRCRFCVICLHDEDLCRAASRVGGHEPVPVRHAVFLRHLWRMHVRRWRRCRIRWRDLTPVDPQ